MMIYFRDYNIPKLTRYNYKKQWYLNAIFAFDTETTTFFRMSGKWVTQDFNDNCDKYSEADKRAVVWIWQLAIDNDVIYGRDIKEFFEFWDEFHKINPYTAIIYIHNLGYDFEFMCEYLPDDVFVFARSAYRPIYAKIPSMGIEFRCSYMLTNMSLDRCAKEFKLPVEKQTGLMAYNVARLPNTPLTEDELKYCEYDVRVMVALIREVFLVRYSRVADIPITQTGEVRRVVKNELKKVKGHMLDMFKIKPDLTLYSILTRVLQGGYTHLNYLYNEKIIHNVVSYDKSSSYPDVICTRKFPCGQFREVTHFHENDSKNCYLLYVRFTNISSIGVWSYIARHKVDKGENIINDNGKMMSAEWCEMWLTDVDYSVIIKNYRIEKIELLRIYRAYSDYLPKRFVEMVLEQYSGKTVYKGVSDMSAYYMRMKQMLNANFGMMITNNIREEQSFEPVEKRWKEPEPLTDEEITDKLKKQRPFLNFAWGVWVTAYARADLWELIKAIGIDCIYCDTDSVKFINAEKYIPVIEEYNARQADRIENVCKIRGLSRDLFYPKTQKGEEKPLGYFELDGKYNDFLSLGAKKYCYIDGDNHFNFVVAGLQKDFVDNENGKGVIKTTMKSMSQFKKQNKIKNGRSIMWHLSDMPDTVLTDYLGNKYTATNRQGIALLNANYTFTIGNEYKDFLKLMKGVVMDGRDKYRNPFRLI